MVQKHSKKLSWDDLEAVLAVGRCGTVRKAAHELDVAHTTVAKKVASAEDKLGSPLFIKTQRGYKPTEEGLRTIRHAEHMANEVEELTRYLHGSDEKLEGEVRVSVNSSLLAYVAIDAISELHRLHPKVVMSFSTEDRLVDITKSEADIVLRMQKRPSEELFGRRLCEVHSAIYMATNSQFFDDYDQKTPVVGWGQNKLVTDTYIKLGVSNPVIVAAAADINVQTAIALSGQAVAELPCYVGNKHSQLTQLAGTETRVINDLWILTHESLKMNGRIRAALDALVTTIVAKRDTIEGIG